MLIWIATLLKEQAWVLQQLYHAVEELEHWRRQAHLSKLALSLTVLVHGRDDWIKQALLCDQDELLQCLRVDAPLVVDRLLVLNDELLEKSCQQDDKHAILVHLELSHESLDLSFLLAHFGIPITIDELALRGG